MWCEAALRGGAIAKSAVEASSDQLTPNLHLEITAIAAIVALSLALRLAWVLLIPAAQYSDSVWYDAAANNLATSGMYGPKEPSAWFHPAIPSSLPPFIPSLGTRNSLANCPMLPSALASPCPPCC